MSNFDMAKNKDTIDAMLMAINACWWNESNKVQEKCLGICTHDLSQEHFYTISNFPW